MAKRDLSARVAEAAEQALRNQQYVSAVDVLMGMGLLIALPFGYALKGWLAENRHGHIRQSA